MTQRYADPQGLGKSIGQTAGLADQPYRMFSRFGKGNVGSERQSGLDDMVVKSHHIGADHPEICFPGHGRYSLLQLDVLLSTRFGESRCIDDRSSRLSFDAIPDSGLNTFLTDG